MKRKVVTMMLMAAMVASLIGCGSSGTDTAQTPGTETNAETGTDGENNAGNDSAVQSIGGAIGGEGEAEAVDVSASVQHEKIIIDADRLSLNPMGLWQSATEVYSMYEMLFQVSNGLGSEMVPVLADASRGAHGGYDHEEGSNEYTFYIYDNIYDHAGNHLTASDVVFSFEKTQEYGQTSGWGVVTSWEAVDDTTVKMTCERELSNKGELENIVLRCFMFTEAAYEASGSEFASDACGTGPYKLENYVEGASVSLVKNEDYWQTDDSKKQSCQYANVDAIDLILITEATQKVTALSTGTIDICQAMPADYIEQYINDDKFTLAAAPSNNVYYLEANVNEASICNDANLRTAIFYAVGTEEMCQGLGAYSNSPVSVFGPSVFPDYNSAWESWDNYQTSAASPEKAAEYLAQSSYNGEELVILCESGGSNMSVLVQALLQAAGINSTITALERNSLNAVSSDPTEWDLYINSTRSSDYLANIWSHVMNKDAFATGTTEGFVDSEEYQDLLKAVLSVNATETDMDAFWQYTVDNAYVEGMCCSTTYIAYPEDMVSGLWMNDKSILLPGAFIYTK